MQAYAEYEEMYMICRHIQKTHEYISSLADFTIFKHLPWDPGWNLELMFLGAEIKQITISRNILRPAPDDGCLSMVDWWEASLTTGWWLVGGKTP